MNCGAIIAAQNPSRTCSICTLIVTLCVPIHTAATQPEIRLRPAVAVSASDFSGVVSVRELGSGELLVADGADNMLYVLSTDLKSRRSLGRQGSGPLEYRSPRFLFELAGDSTLVPDGANRRWLIAKSRALVSTVAASHEALRSIGANLIGADTSGHVAATRRTGVRVRVGGATVESLLVVRGQRKNGRVDTIARLRGRPVDSRELDKSRSTNPMIATALGVPLETSEQALLFADGWLAIARLDPYRVEWIAPTGTRVASPAIRYRPIVVDSREKAAHFARVNAQARPRGAAGPVAERPGTLWPDEASPFADEALRAAPNGELLVRRRAHSTDPVSRYDVISRSGGVRATLVLPINARVVGYGNGALYVAVSDDDGLDALFRHAWPAPS
jgi:hypothetical protein